MKKPHDKGKCARGVGHPSRMSLRIDKKTHDKIKSLADKSGISVSEWIRQSMQEKISLA